MGSRRVSTLPSAMRICIRGALAVSIVRKGNALFQEREDCLVQRLSLALFPAWMRLPFNLEFRVRPTAWGGSGCATRHLVRPPGEAPQDIRDAPLSAAFLRDTPWADIVQRDNTHGHRRSNRLIVKFRIGP